MDEHFAKYKWNSRSVLFKLLVIAQHKFKVPYVKLFAAIGLWNLHVAVDQQADCSHYVCAVHWSKVPFTESDFVLLEVQMNSNSRCCLLGPESWVMVAHSTDGFICLPLYTVNTALLHTDLWNGDSIWDDHGFFNPFSLTNIMFPLHVFLSYAVSCVRLHSQQRLWMKKLLKFLCISL